MSSGTDKEGTKLHGDKLESVPNEHQQANAPKSALDQLEIPPHEEPQTDGGTKIHGDKLDPHSGPHKS
jgi:hypothetical protein